MVVEANSLQTEIYAIHTQPKSKRRKKKRKWLKIGKKKENWNIEFQKGGFPFSF